MYQYCQANPVGYVDPSGHTCEIVQNHYEQYQEYQKQHPEATAAEAYEAVTGKDPLKKDAGKSGKKTIKSTLENKIDVTPSSKHTSVNKNPGPYGEANTSVDILDAEGNIKTRRWYDSDGKAYRDVDMSDHGNPKEHPEVPHEHTWEYNNGKPKRN